MELYDAEEEDVKPQGPVLFSEKIQKGNNRMWRWKRNLAHAQQHAAIK